MPGLAHPKIKICGINAAGFALAAENAGIDYLGFIFFKKSPRNLSLDSARAIISRLSGRAGCVGVFVDTPADEIEAVSRALGFAAVQLHGPYPAESAAKLKKSGLEVWKVAHSAADILPDYPADAFLVDSKSTSLPGGTGERSDWSMIPEIRALGRKAVLAGGISPENFREAAASGADVLDFNSSLESAPGVKSLSRLQELLAAIRR